MFKVNKKLTILLGLIFMLTIVPIVVASTAVITTDKEIYEPGETVLITGQGFTSNGEVLISITKPDPNTGLPEGEVVTNTVYSDVYGNFNFSYLLNDSLFGDYIVEATDGINTAVTTFFDPKKVDMVDEPLTTEGTENEINWLYDEEPEYYEVQASLDDKFRTDIISGIVSASIKQYTFTDLVIGNTYYYRVRAIFEKNSSPWSKAVFSQQVAAPPDTISPEAPRGLNAITTVDSISLTWAANTESDLAGYKVYWGTTLGEYTNSAVVNEPAYTIPNLNSNTTYYIAVTAYDNAPAQNESIKTEIQATTETPADTTPPAVPTGLSLTANISEVTVNWKANTESDVAGYKVHYGTNPSSYKVIDVGKVNSYKITGLSPMTAYSFAISAYDNATNASSTSNALAVENLNPTIIEVNRPGYSFTGNWLNSTYATFQGRLCKYTKVVGSSVTYQFSGTGISWLATKSAWGAIGKVYIDDVYVASVDTYNPTNLYQQVVFSKNGLSQGSHKIKIVFTGEKNPAASQSGLSLDVDAFKVW